MLHLFVAWLASKALITAMLSFLERRSSYVSGATFLVCPATQDAPASRLLNDTERRSLLNALTRP